MSSNIFYLKTENTHETPISDHSPYFEFFQVLNFSGKIGSAKTKMVLRLDSAYHIPLRCDFRNYINDFSTFFIILTFWNFRGKPFLKNENGAQIWKQRMLLSI